MPLHVAFLDKFFAAVSACVLLLVEMYAQVLIESANPGKLLGTMVADENLPLARGILIENDLPGEMAL